MKSNQIYWIFLAVVHNLPIGEDGGSPNLQALKLIGRIGSATLRSGILKRGLLLIAAGSSSLGELLVSGSRSMA
jgi:hypothetical protein